MTSIQGRIHVWSESAPAPPFWQINHANSAYFRLFLSYFGVISATRAPPLLDLGLPFLHILDPPLVFMLLKQSITQKFLIMIYVAVELKMVLHLVKKHMFCLLVGIHSHIKTCAKCNRSRYTVGAFSARVPIQSEKINVDFQNLNQCRCV